MTKKILGFGWSKKVKMTLETISFWWNISINIFKFSPFLCLPMKSFQSFKIYKYFDKKREKTLIQQSMSCILFNNWLFYKSLQRDNKSIFLFRVLICSEFFSFWNQDYARGNWERQIAKNGKLQYLFQKQLQLLM